MMRAQNTPFIRIYDGQDQRLFTFDNSDIDITISQMDQMLPYVNTYGRLKVEAATQSIRNRKWQDAYWWNLELDRPAAAQGVTVNAPAIPTGYVHQDLLAKEIAILNLKFEHEKELRRLQDEAKEKDRQDPMKIGKELLPALMYISGKPVEEIGKMYSILNNPGVFAPGAIAGLPAAATHTLKFKDVENMSADDKHKKLQASLNELAKHCSIEHTILLVDGLCKKLDPAKGGKPENINTILSFL